MPHAAPSPDAPSTRHARASTASPHHLLRARSRSRPIARTCGPGSPTGPGMAWKVSTWSAIPPCLCDSQHGPHTHKQRVIPSVTQTHRHDPELLIRSPGRTGWHRPAGPTAASAAPPGLGSCCYRPPGPERVRVRQQIPRPRSGAGTTPPKRCSAASFPT